MIRWPALGAVLLLAILPLPAFAAGTTYELSNDIYTERSLYRNIYVDETSGLRCMRFILKIGARQSCVDLSDHARMPLNYAKLMMGSLYLNPAPKTALVIGLGGGTLARSLHDILPDIQVTAVEIDPAVRKVALKYFYYVEDARLTTEIEDGRVFVKRMQRAHKSFDLIMLDAYNQEYIPEHMLTREFLQEVQSILTDGGVLAANTHSSSKLYDSESTTYTTVFGPFYNLKLNNRIILLKKGPLPSMDEVAANGAKLDPLVKPLDMTSEWLLPMFSTKPDWDQSARVLTDEYSPSNLLNGTTH